MSDQKNSSFAHAFLPGLILGLIIGAVAGAFVPDMMSAPKIKVDPSRVTTGERAPRDGQGITEIDAETQALIDEAEKAAQDAADHAHDTAEDVIDDAEHALPTTP